MDPSVSIGPNVIVNGSQASTASPPPLPWILNDLQKMAGHLQTGNIIGEISDSSVSYAASLVAPQTSRVIVKPGNPKDPVWPLKSDSVDFLILIEPNLTNLTQLAQEAARVTQTTKLCTVIISAAGGSAGPPNVHEIEAALAAEGLYIMRRAPLSGIYKEAKIEHTILVSRKVRPWNAAVSAPPVQIMGAGGKMG